MANLAKKVSWIGSNMANFGHFAGFSPKVMLRLTQNGQFHPISNFSHLLPSKRIIFVEILKIFISDGGGLHQQIFLSFSTFLNCFTPKGLQMTHNGKFGQKKVS